MTSQPDEYELIDSGNEARLERVGPFLLNRPAPQAIWAPRLSREEWDRADAVCRRTSRGGGEWRFRTRLPESWPITCHGLRMEIRPTPFGHLGLFPEQVTNWQWIESRIGESGRSLSLLNLFAYTGGATLCAARAGASVCHVDASRGVVSWARLNTAASGLTDRPVRWIIEDVTKFLSREERRGRTYDALVLDPPSFGRGAKGEVFKIERDLVRTLELAMAILAQPPRFILLTCHSPGMTPLVLRNLLEPFTSRYGGSTEASEMVVHDRGGRPLPSGSAVRWSAP